MKASGYCAARLKSERLYTPWAASASRVSSIATSIATSPLPVTLCPLAADHLPVFAVLIVPTAAVAQTLRINL